MAAIVKRRGAYYLDFRNALGARIQKRFRTRAEAVDAFKLLVPLSGQRRGQLVGVDPRITVGAWVHHWLRQTAPPALKPCAWEAHHRACTRFIIPALGALRLTELRRGQIRAFLLYVQAHGRGPCRRPACRGAGAGCAHAAAPLAPGSVRHVYSALRACLQAAVDDELLPANPAAKLGGKRGLRVEPTKRERRQRIEQRVLAADELAQLTTATRRTAPAWYPLLLTYARAGLRLGEAIALEVEDFNPTAAILHVRQAFDQRRMRLGPPKHGPRDVDLTLSPELVSILRAHVSGLKRNALRTGQSLARWLFPSRTGTPVQARNVERAIARLARQAGLKRAVSPHDLRHTYGTLLIEAGVSPVYVQRQLGHASIQLTVDTYGATARPRLPANAVGLFDEMSATDNVTAEAAGQSAPTEAPATPRGVRSGDIVVTSGRPRRAGTGASRRKNK
jgi:integrase